MHYILFILLVLIIAVLVICLRKKDREIQAIQSEVTQLKKHAEQAKKEAMVSDTVQEEAEPDIFGNDFYHIVWNRVNTIHLYASLTEGEDTSASVKEKQTEIIRMSEEILNLF